MSNRGDKSQVYPASAAPVPPPVRPVPAPADDGQFEILESSFEIAPRDDRYMRAAVYGVLAHVPGYGRLARWEARYPTGNLSFGYTRIFADPTTAREGLAGPTDELAEAAGMLEQSRVNPRQRLTKMERSPLEAEVERFARDYPMIVDRLGLSRARIDRLFDPGDVYRPATIDPRVGEIDWEDFRDRHVAGDWGVVGRHDPSSLGDPATLFTIGLQPVALKNSWCIQEGRGVVRSEYPVEGKPAVTIRVITALAGQRYTIMRAFVSNPA